MNESDFTEVALPFAVLILQDVALALFAAKHLSSCSNFEPFGNGFSRFGYTGIFGHRGSECRGSRLMGNLFFALLETQGSGLSEFPRWVFSKVGIKKCRIAKIKVY